MKVDHMQSRRDVKSLPILVDSAVLLSLKCMVTTLNIMPTESDPEEQSNQHTHTLPARLSYAEILYNRHRNSDASTRFSKEFEWGNPFGFPNAKKWVITVVAAACTFTCTFSSSIYSSANAATSKQFHVSETVAMLGVSLYVLGFGAGPLFWSPLSEHFGRRYPLLVGFVLFALMQIPVALSPDFAGVLIARFLAGCFGAAPLTVVTAIYADFWNPAERGIATSIYSLAALAGPACGPIVGSFITESYLGWRWTAWITLILAAAVFPFAYLFIPETYAPILKERALYRTSAMEQLKRSATRASSREARSHFLREVLLKPAIMLFTEPMLVMLTLYTSIAYGLIYLCFFALPYSFDTKRHWNPREGSLTFISLLVGIILAGIMNILCTKYYYRPRLEKRGSLNPNDRLPLALVGSVILPIGMFWFGWTSFARITWVPQAISTGFIGAGIMLVFSSCLTLIDDIYLGNATSALAIAVSFRNIVAAGLPLAGPKMYESLGVPWASSVLGFICVAMIPVPLMFWKYGDTFRARSRYADKPVTTSTSVS